MESALKNKSVCRVRPWPRCSLADIEYGLSVRCHSSTLKRLVITSSVAAVIVPEPTGPRHQNGAPYTFTEEDWNEYSPGVIEREGHEAPGADKYRASKVGIWAWLWLARMCRESLTRHFRR